MNAIRWMGALAVAAALAAPAAAQGLRAEVGKPLQQAAELLKAGKAREALAKVRDAEAAANKTAAEQTAIDRMKGAAAQRAGDLALAIQAFEAVFPKLSGSEAAQVAETIAGSYAQLRNNAKATEWVNKAAAAGGGGASLKQLQSYLQSQSGDYGAIARDAGAAVAAAEQAGRRPAEDDLLRLADAQNRLNQGNAYIATLEKLVAHYGKKDYWLALLSRLPRKSGFADRLALDVMRLRLASGTLAKTEDFMEMAQLALQAGLPSEGLKIVDRGIELKLLGTGPEADRHKRLRDLAVKKDADAKAALSAALADAAGQKDGNALVLLGYQQVVAGDFDNGIATIEKGIAKGSLKRPEDAKLRLGMALLQAGKRSKAMPVLKSVGGNDGAADIARLWIYLGGNGG